MNIYVYRRFVRKLGISRVFKKILKTLLVIIFFSEAIYAFSFRVDIFPSYIYYLLSAAIGISFMFFIVALVYDFMHIVLSRTKIHDLKKERLKAALDVIMAILLIVYMSAGFIGGRAFPALKSTNIQIAGFPFEKFVIVQITDLHVGNTIKKDFVKKIVDTVNGQNPDMIVITGDLVDKDIEKIAEDIEPLKELNSSLGTFFVYGNHEYFHGYQKTGEYLKKLNIDVLDDEARMIERDGKRFNLVGLKDKIGERFGFGRADIQKAFRQIDNRYKTIVLVHQPVMIEEFEKYNPALVLSGHTHGGQIFPFSYLVKMAQPYLSGLYRHSEDTMVYVSRGTGFWGPPVRVLAPSEISKLIITPTITPKD